MKILFQSLMLLTLSGLVGAAGRPTPGELMKALFPGEKISAVQQHTKTSSEKIIIGAKYQAEIPRKGLNTCSILAGVEGTSATIFAVTITPLNNSGDPSNPFSGNTWENFIVYGVLKNTGSEWRVTSRLQINPENEKGFLDIAALRTIPVNGRRLIQFDYKYGSSRSTPRAWITMTKLLRIDEKSVPAEVWSMETKYGFGGSSQPEKDRIVEWSFKNINGVEALETRTTTVEDDYFVWKDNRLVHPGSYPVR